MRLSLPYIKILPSTGTINRKSYYCHCANLRIMTIYTVKEIESLFGLFCKSLTLSLCSAEGQIRKSRVINQKQRFFFHSLPPHNNFNGTLPHKNGKRTKNCFIFTKCPLILYSLPVRRTHFRQGQRHTLPGQRAGTSPKWRAVRSRASL